MKKCSIEVVQGIVAAHQEQGLAKKVILARKT